MVYVWPLTVLLKVLALDSPVVVLVVTATTLVATVATAVVSTSSSVVVVLVGLLVGALGKGLFKKRAENW